MKHFQHFGSVLRTHFIVSCQSLNVSSMRLRKLCRSPLLFSFIMDRRRSN